jgi:hypothetical protein
MRICIIDECLVGVLAGVLWARCFAGRIFLEAATLNSWRIYSFIRVHAIFITPFGYH